MSSTIRNQSVVFQSYLSSDSSFNADTQIGCNLSNTPILSTYPSAPTASKGTYIFADASSSTKILTAGGTNDKAGISLEVCSSISAPYSVLLANKNGITSKAITAYDGSNTGRLDVDGIHFNGLNYKTKIDGNTTNIQEINAVTIPNINSRLDIEENKSSLIDDRMTNAEALGLLHTSQIANLSAVDVTELAKISDLEARDLVHDARFVVDEAKIKVIEDKQPVIVLQPIYHVASVYADSQQMIDYIPASISAVTPYSGFYFKNEVNKKVNWYLAGFAGMKVKDVKGLMLNFYNVTATTGLGCPFFTAYTKTDALTANAASWYKSRKTFSVEYTSATTPSTAYNLLANLKSLPYTPIAWNHKKVDSVGIPANDKGSFADEEEILFFSIGTSSNSAAGLFEFIASKFTIFTSDCCYEYQLIQK